MLERWLKEEPPTRRELLQLTMLRQITNVDDQLIEWLGRELERNYVTPGELGLIFDDLGAPEVAEHLRKNKFPTQISVRNGDFGEAITAAWYRRVRRWCVPVLKLRYKHRPNQPVQGVDVIGFRLRTDPPVIAVPEVKTRTTKKLDIGVEAQMSLEKVLLDLPQAITFVVARLNDRGIALAARIAELLKRPYDLERHIVLVSDDDIWSEEIIDRLEPKVTQETSVSVMQIPALADLITKAYSAALTAVSRKASAGSSTSISPSRQAAMPAGTLSTSDRAAEDVSARAVGNGSDDDR
jgi:hypothetical protein